MRTLSMAYLNAAKAAGRYPDLYAIIYGSGSNLTISGKDAIISANIVKGDTAKPAYFEVGRAISSNAYLTVDRRRISAESYIVSGAKIEIYAEFDRPDGTAIGSEILATMFISGYDTQDEEIGYISAVDKLVYAGKDFNPDGLTYPITLSDLMTEAFAQSGMSGVAMTLPCDPHVNSAPYKASEPVADGMSGDPYICRDVIAKIAGMQMSDIFIDAEGNPDIYAYGNYITTAVTDSLILEMRVGSEQYQVYQVLVKGYGERMVKDDAHFQRLPYSPRFEDMDNYHQGSDWWNEIVDRANIFVRKDWATAVITIAGVGELELGDFVLCGSAEIPIFISGIVYNFENAHFTETLYSFAYTLEEYYQAPASATVVKTDRQEVSTGGDHIFSPNEPGATPEGSDGDYWLAFTGDTVTHAYKKVNSQWEERSFTVGSQTPQTANVGDLFINGSKAAINVIVEYRSFDYDPETGTFDFEGDTYRGWLQFYPSETFRQSGDTHDCFTTDGGVINDGDIWFQTASAANNAVTKIHERVSGAWAEQGTFGGVGLNVGKHNEIFNDYAGNTIISSGSTEEYNHVEGLGNTADGCYHSHITGKNNAAYHAAGSYVGGQGNTVGQTHNASWHFVHGSGNVSDGGSSNTVFGTGNTLDRSHQSFIAGGYNSANRGYHYILGTDNTSGGDAEYNVLLGYHNKSQYHSAFMIGIGGETTDNNQFVFSSGRTTGNTFVIDKDGNVSAKSYTTPGADYAELFEWVDGNPDNEDRRGMLVTLDGDKLVPANGDDILGAVSSRPSVVGNSADEYWRGKYKTDVFGEVIRDENGEPVLSEDYDESIAYTPRSKRREWSPVGMVGRLIVCDNGKCVPNGYVTAHNGIAVPSGAVTNIRVLRRADDTHIEVLIK